MLYFWQMDTELTKQIVRTVVQGVVLRLAALALRVCVSHADLRVSSDPLKQNPCRCSPGNFILRE